MTHSGAGADGLATRAADAFRAYREGDPSGMPTLVDDVTPLLWSVARQQGLSHASAEDVVQSSWLKLVQHAARIADPQSVLKWLITTTKRDAWLQSSKRQREGPAAGEAVGEREMEAPGPAPDAVVIAEADHRLLWDHFARLPERCRMLLRAVAFADRPDYAGVAEALGMPVGSIGPTRGRCLAKLRASLTSDPRWEMTT